MYSPPGYRMEQRWTRMTGRQLISSLSSGCGARAADFWSQLHQGESEGTAGRKLHRKCQLSNFFSVFWNRIWIGSDQASGSGSEFLIRIQEGKNDPQNQKNVKNFHVLKWLRAEGFSSSLDVLYGDLAVNLFQILIRYFFWQNSQDFVNYLCIVFIFFMANSRCDRKRVNIEVYLFLLIRRRMTTFC
jgi:hypothetical protein